MAREIKDFWKGTINRDKTFYEQYGRCINFSYGLIIGLIIDKILFYLTKGLSIAFPPMSILLMNRGKVIFTLRFDREFSKVTEKFLNHIITK